MALIRCKSCNNPISSRLSACPFCGASIDGAAEATAAQTANAVNTINDQNAAPRRTLNDIIAERQTRSATINDTHTKPEVTVVLQPQPKVEPKPVVEPKPEPKPEPKAEPKPVPQPEPKAEPKPVPQPAPKAEPKPAPQPKSNLEPARVAYDAGYNREERIIDDLEAEIVRHKRSSAGFLILSIVLLVALVPLTIFAVQNYDKVKTIEKDYALVESARRLFEEQNTLLQRDAESLVKELERYKGKNDTMMQRYQEAVTMLEQLQREKAYNYNQLAKYRKEVSVLKGVMKGYLRQIDSLNYINTDLKAKNTAYERERRDYLERTEKAEELAEEYKTKVRIGSVIRTGGVHMVALNENSRPVKRMKVASRLRVDFELTANELAEPGEKIIYVRITGPDGYPLPSAKNITFDYEGESLTASAMRKVSYENQSVPVSVFYDNESFDPGEYSVDIYVDGRHCGGCNTYFE